MSIGHTKNLPALPLGLLAPDPGDFLCGQKGTKKPLKKLRFLRIFLHYGGFCLRHDLFDSFPQCLLWADAGRIAGTTPWPFSLFRWVRLREARFFGETTGPPARCGRYCPAMPGRQHPALCGPRRPWRCLSRPVIPDARIKAFPRSPPPAYLPRALHSSTIFKK